MNPSLPRRELLAATGCALAAALIAPTASAAGEEMPTNQEKKMRLATAQSTHDLKQIAVIFVGARAAVLPVAIAQFPKTNRVPERPANLA